MNAKIRNYILALAGKLGAYTDDMVHVVLYYSPKSTYWTCSITLDQKIEIPYFYVHPHVRQEGKLSLNSIRITNSTAFSGIASLEAILKFYLNEKTKNTAAAQVERMLEQRMQELKDQYHNEQKRKTATRRKSLAK